MNKIYECKEPLEMTREEFERINKFFKVNFDDESPEMEALINELDARPNTLLATYIWEFEGTNFVVQMDIESDDVCYMDNVAIIDTVNDEDYWIDGRSFSIDETMIFFDGENNYICKIKIIEEDK